MAMGGPSTSGIFDLKQPARYLFQTTGSCRVPRYSRARTLINELGTGRSYEIAGAEIGAGMDSDFRLLTSGSLLLAPGRYSWSSEINPNPVDQIANCRMSIDVVDSPAAIESRGLRRASSAMSGRAGTNVFAEGFFFATALGDTEALTAQLVVLNLRTNQEFKSPLIEVVGATDGEVSTGVVPYVLVAGDVYRSTLTLNYNGNSAVSCLLRQRIG